MRLLPPPPAGRIQPPLIPVIDVVFDLLIFFLLIPSVAPSNGYLTTNLPEAGGGRDGGQQVDPGKLFVRIALQDEGPRSEDVSIVLNDTKDLGTRFDALRDGLIELRARGLSEHVAILIAPTQACRQKYVVQAFDAAVAAGFTDIHFAVPYE
jgi:biopolymer transport protein ExbD